MSENGNEVMMQVRSLELLLLWHSASRETEKEAKAVEPDQKAKSKVKAEDRVRNGKQMMRLLQVLGMEAASMLLILRSCLSGQSLNSRSRALARFKFNLNV